MIEENVESRPRRPWTFSLAVGILISGLWLAAAIPAVYWTLRGTDGESYVNQAVLELARTDLALRAAGLRRYAEVNGHLPADLAGCGSLCPTLADVLQHIREPSHPAAEEPLLLYIDEAWVSEVVSRDHGVPAAPGAAQDLFGLPIVYRKGVEEPDEGSFLSSEPLPPLVERFVASKGTPPSPSPEPFTLASLFLRERLSDIAWHERTAIAVLSAALLGFLALLVGTFWRTIRSRRVRSSTWGKVGVAAATFVSTLTVFLGLATTTATCYARSRFRTRSLSKGERLVLLEKAVRTGDVPPAVEKAARAYLEKLP